jgi:hypothetical protein
MLIIQFNELKYQLDNSQTAISLIDEPFFFNSVLSESSKIAQNTENRELTDKMLVLKFA